MTTRSGIGYDSHRFAPGGPLRLGGVDISSDVHLTGHSDGDAVAHAITDALLGAAAAGDIGDRDPANRGRDSIEMLRVAVDRIGAMGWHVANADVCVVAERPRILEHRDAMRGVLARALGLPLEDVSVKGKSNEGMGWIGRGEGLACIAIVTLSRH